MTPAGKHAGRYRAAHLHQPGGWLSPRHREVNPARTIAAVEAERPTGWAEGEVRRLDAYVVPGMANLHSHAHRRGLAGDMATDGSVGPDLGGVEKEFPSPDQPGLLAEVDDVLEEPFEDLHAQPLADAG